ncbi:hypothetical protein Tco_0950048, partial [Tanacetum coccineum]
DENMVRLWLKDHQDAAKKLARQQAKAFQLQFDTLHAELQATRGDDPDRWIFAITEYFSLLSTPVDQRFPVVGFNMEGVSKYEDLEGALLKLLQLGVVEDYQWEFEKLVNKVTDILDSFLISFYISGLKLHLQRELLVSKPTTLGEVFSLVRITEARFEDERSTTAITKPNDLNTGVQVQDLEETIRHKTNKVDVVKKSIVATFEEYEHQENQDNLNEISEEKEDAKPPISADTFGSNGGNDSETSGPETPAKEVVDNDNSSTLFYLVEHGSPRFLQPGERIGIGDVHKLVDNKEAIILFIEMRSSGCICKLW